jgi:hypothetical protein
MWESVDLLLGGCPNSEDEPEGNEIYKVIIVENNT